MLHRCIFLGACCMNARVVSCVQKSNIDPDRHAFDAMIAVGTKCGGKKSIDVFIPDVAAVL